MLHPLLASSAFVLVARVVLTGAVLAMTAILARRR
jgi:hypothetical protein